MTAMAVVMTGTAILLCAPATAVSGGSVAGQTPSTPLETFGSAWTRLFQLGGSGDRIGTDAPATAFLDQNFPNPFNPSTRIRYGNPIAGRVVLTVYSLVGRPVVTLVDGWHEPGTYGVEFVASELPSGVYFYRLHTDAGTITRRMTVSK